MKTSWSPPPDLSGRVRWAFLVAALVCLATSSFQMMAAPEVPVLWRACGLLLVVGVAVGEVRGHRRGAFGLVATLAGAGILVPIGLTMGDPFRTTEMIYVVLFHQALYRTFRSLALAVAGALLGLVLSIVIATFIIPDFEWDIFEVLLQIPALLLVGVIHMLGVSIGRHERAALRERALATTGSDLVAADKPCDAYTVAMTGAKALIEPHAQATLTLSIGTRDQLRIVAATNHDVVGLSLDINKSPPLRDRLLEQRVFELSPEQARDILKLMGARSVGEFDQFTSSLLVVPMMVQRELRGAITVATSKSLPDECKDGLATLATEVALSLETMDLNGRLLHQAYHDPLTDLANRVLLADKAREAFELGQVAVRQTALLVLDLDSFKVVNDTLGHAAGDRMLVAIAERLVHSLPEAHCVARLGGDEFAVLIHDLEQPLDEAQVLAERLLGEFRQPLLVDGNMIVPQASIGVVVGDESQGFDALLADADLAMYAAKRAGKGRFVMFEAGLREAVRRQLELEMELRAAIEREEFELVYQPIIDFTGGQLLGLEALVRWRHPRRGLLAPGEFIEHAEATGLIVPIGRWILREACRQAAEWGLTTASGAPVRIGVNLSPRQLQQGDVDQMVRWALAETGLSANALTLEITETGLVERTEEVLRQLRTVQALGVHLALDDFGTGYSSLAYLRDFPFDVVKIDRSFVDGVENNTEQAAFVSAIVTLTHTLKMRAIGEGIETAAQYARLRALGCDFGQGYHIARPLKAEAVSDWLASTDAERAA